MNDCKCVYSHLTATSFSHTIHSMSHFQRIKMQQNQLRQRERIKKPHWNTTKKSVHIKISFFDFNLCKEHKYGNKMPTSTQDRYSSCHACHLLFILSESNEFKFEKMIINRISSR